MLLWLFETKRKLPALIPCPALGALQREHPHFSPDPKEGEGQGPTPPYRDTGEFEGKFRKVTDYPSSIAQKKKPQENV